MGPELFRADGGQAGIQTGRHDDANNNFSQFCERLKNPLVVPHIGTLQPIHYTIQLLARDQAGGT